MHPGCIDYIITEPNQTWTITVQPDGNGAI